MRVAVIAIEAFALMASTSSIHGESTEAYIILMTLTSVHLTLCLAANTRTLEILKSLAPIHSTLLEIGFSFTLHGCIINLVSRGCVDDSVYTDSNVHM
jgi:hypothetical protein